MTLSYILSRCGHVVDAIVLDIRHSDVILRRERTTSPTFGFPAAQTGTGSRAT